MNSFVVQTFFVLFSIFATCYTAPTDYGFGGESGGYGYSHEEYHEAKPYAFGYSVKDFKKGTNFNQHETSDGHNIKGEYAVALPDGRMQIVSYVADWKNGYHADVKYVGEAHHPELYSTHNGYDIHSSVPSYGYEGGHGSSESGSHEGYGGSY